MLGYYCASELFKGERICVFYLIVTAQLNPIVIINQAYSYNSQHRSCLSYFKFLQEKSGNVEGIIILHLEIFKVSDFCIWPLYGCTVIVCVGWIKIFNNIDFQFLLPLI